MPVSVITDVVTWIELIAQLGITGLELRVLSYLVFEGGWLDMIRMISFWLDNFIIKYTDMFYQYFEKILAGQIFSPTVVDDVMSRVYIFVSLFVLLKLLMLFMKYLANPEMVSDDKVGAQALIKRVIIGMCGMLMLPYIFNFAIDLQKAIISDNVLGQLLLDKGQIKEYEKNKDQMGRMLAFNVYQAFFNLDKNRVTSSKIQKNYENAISAMDPGVIGDINEKFGGDYAYEYFPIASTVVLLYVIYLVIKYCIDVVVRMFKLFLLQMLGPLAISDYMVNGDSKEVFKNWLKTTISVYAMLFVRIFSIWFIAFIMILMQGDCTHFEKDADGNTTTICIDESILYIEPGKEPDYLLKGIITLGLLALLMDLPKFFSDILGLDLEQDASVKGIMQKVGGAAKGVAMGGLAVGGAAIGGAIGGAKNAISAGKGLATSRLQNKGKLDGKLSAKSPEFAQKMADAQQKKAQISGLDKVNPFSKAQKDFRQSNKALKQERKAQMKDSKNAVDVQEYKKSQKDAGMKAASQFTTSAGGIARGGFTALANAVPGLKDAFSGYNQGKGAVQQESQERAKTYDETKGVHDAYSQGVSLAVNDIKTDKELSLDVNGQLNEVKMDGVKAGQVAVDLVPNKSQLEGQTIDMNVNLNSSGDVKNAPKNLEMDATINSNGNVENAPKKLEVEVSHKKKEDE